MKKWMISILLFSVAVNVSVLATLIYYWKKPVEHTQTMTWHTVDTHNADDIMIFKDDSLLESKPIKRYKLKWSDQIHTITTDISDDREHIIQLMLKEPPDTDSIAIVIDTLVIKQIKAEKYTIDHLLEIKDLMPQDEWQNIVRSLHQPKQIIIHKQINGDVQKGKTLIHVNDFEINTKEIIE